MTHHTPTATEETMDKAVALVIVTIIMVVVGGFAAGLAALP